jgi:hypothetical protein
MSNFKELIDHYKTLSNDDLIEKLVLKNAKLLAQEKEIERQADEIKRLADIEDDHRKLNGKIHKELHQLKNSQQQPEGVNTNEN